MATEIENEDDLWRTAFVHFMKVTDDCEQAKQQAAFALGAYRDRHTPPSLPDTSRADDSPPSPDFQVSKDDVATFTMGEPVAAVDFARAHRNACEATGLPSDVHDDGNSYSGVTFDDMRQEIANATARTYENLGDALADMYPAADVESHGPGSCTITWPLAQTLNTTLASAHDAALASAHDAIEKGLKLTPRDARALLADRDRLAREVSRLKEPQLDATPEPIEVSCLLAATGSQLDERGKKAAAYDEITEALGFVDETPTTSEVVACARKASDALTDAGEAAPEHHVRRGMLVYLQALAAAYLAVDPGCPANPDGTGEWAIEDVASAVTELRLERDKLECELALAAGSPDSNAETERKREQVHELISTATGTTLDSFGRWLAFFRYGGLSEPESDSDYREQLLAHLPSVSLECVDRLLSKYTIGDATHEQTSEEACSLDACRTQR